jgi:hypothetical protein
LVCVLATQAAIAEVDFRLIARDVITETPSAHTEPVLALSWLHTRELPDGMSAADVARIFLEDADRRLKNPLQVGVLLSKFDNQPLAP